MVVPCAMLWVQVWTIGMLNEGRPYALYAELARVLVIVPGGTALQEDNHGQLAHTCTH